MVNKKGIIKIIEATLSILIIIGVLLAISVNRERIDNRDLTERIPPILDEISKNLTLRNAVLSGNQQEINNFISAQIPETTLNFSLKICDPESVCSLDEYHPDIYAGERIISTNLTYLAPKRIKLFIWKV